GGRRAGPHGGPARGQRRRGAPAPRRRRPLPGGAGPPRESLRLPSPARADPTVPAALPGPARIRRRPPDPATAAAPDGGAGPPRVAPPSPPAPPHRPAPRRLRVDGRLLGVLPAARAPLGARRRPGRGLHHGDPPDPRDPRAAAA